MHCGLALLEVFTEGGHQGTEVKELAWSQITGYTREGPRYLLFLYINVLKKRLFGSEMTDSPAFSHGTTFQSLDNWWGQSSALLLADGR